MTKILFSSALLAMAVHAGDKAAWKQRSIYQVITDRFARDDGSTEACTSLR